MLLTTSGMYGRDRRIVCVQMKLYMIVSARAATSEIEGALARRLQERHSQKNREYTCHSMP